MARLILVEFLMFIGTLGMTYLLRRAAGKRISGPPVILWCLLFALIGSQLMGFFLRQMALDVDFIDLSAASNLNFVFVIIRVFWENILIGGILGMIAANFPLRKHKKPIPEDTQPKR
jgi:hypothetical protein